MRYIVDYTKPGCVGRCLFDYPGEKVTNKALLFRIAAAAAGKGAVVLAVKKNDGRSIGEWSANPKAEKADVGQHLRSK
jgi:hypothetical protein